jgi:transcriptional regulator with XRE-family HTH domain
MKTGRQKMISQLVKEARAARGYTQKELSERSNISIRSIQRIENGEIIPRSYTLKTLAEILGISFEDMQESNPVQKSPIRISKGQKIILSVSIPLFVFLACWAFIAQSPRFPETTFELLVLATCMTILVTIVLIVIWRTRS